ncbi:NAD(P)/FAD-dependent oxidoreductase [Microbacteriaceae bacterium VKM Ac-2855]|nr:NAD(P)/FAD-dependent oxidoreductase [Microbacteriaceae bacterium VKM Ac-2855]
MTDEQYDVVIVGGGPAGASAAVALGRARRSVLLLDAGEPRNAPADGVHNVLTRDGTPPLELLALARAEAEGYGVTVRRARVVSASATAAGVEVRSDEGRYRGRRLLLAGGVVDELPDIPGLRERWGRDAIHCPYCHGWEVRDRPLGVLGTGPMSVHQALLFRQWSASITLFLNDVVQPSEAEREQFAARGIRVVTGRVERIRVDPAAETIAGVEVAGVLHPLPVVVVASRLSLRLPEGLDPALAEHPMGVGLQLVVDAQGRTSVPRVSAAGNLVDLSAQVMPAAASGLMAGAALNADLTTEDTSDAVARLRKATNVG